MVDSVSVRELLNTGQRGVATGRARRARDADRRPVAELVPLRRRGSVSAEALAVAPALTVAQRSAADRGLLRLMRESLPDSTGDL